MVAAGDFTVLAEQYSKYRVGYHEDVLSAILGLFSSSPGELDFVDVGAGTGIWTRMVAGRGLRCQAVEPNDAMRQAGQASNGEMQIRWHAGSAEKIPLPTGSCDWISMASSFHWANFEQALGEFHRVLRPGGWFTCLWNPRAVERHAITREIENSIKEIVPELNRRSSGRSQFTNELSERLPSTGQFQCPVYMEAPFTIDMTREQYLGVWDSVNDIQAQAGPDRWRAIRQLISERTQGEVMIPCAYWTRAWSCQRID